MTAPFTIKPYRKAGEWCFDDDARGLLAEPFILGMSEIISKAVDVECRKNHYLGRSRCTLTFSAEPLPGHGFTLEWLEAEEGGNWYACPELDDIGWLCPAFYKYFAEAPARIYVRIAP